MSRSPVLHTEKRGKKLGSMLKLPNIYPPPNGLAIFGCDLDAGIETLPDAFDAPPWAKLEIKKLVKADPFTLDHDAMRFADDLILLRDGYTQFDITQH